MTEAEQGLKVSPAPQGVRFAIHVSARARKARVGGLHGDALRVAVAAPPVEGAANQACVAALAKALGLAKREIEIAAGARSRRKQIVARGRPTALERRLRELAAH